MRKTAARLSVVRRDGGAGAGDAGVVDAPVDGVNRAVVASVTPGSIPSPFDPDGGRHGAEISPAVNPRRYPQRLFTTYYHARRNTFHPIRVSHSSSPAAALAAVVRRIYQGERISVAEVCDRHGNLVRLLVHSRGRIVIE